MLGLVPNNQSTEVKDATLQANANNMTAIEFIYKVKDNANRETLYNLTATLPPH